MTTKAKAPKPKAKPKNLTTITARENSASYWAVSFLCKDPSMGLDALIAKLKREKKIDAPTQVKNSYMHFQRTWAMLQQMGRVK